MVTSAVEAGIRAADAGILRWNEAHPAVPVPDGKRLLLAYGRNGADTLLCALPSQAKLDALIAQMPEAVRVDPWSHYMVSNEDSEFMRVYFRQQARVVRDASADEVLAMLGDA